MWNNLAVEHEARRQEISSQAERSHGAGRPGACKTYPPPPSAPPLYRISSSSPPRLAGRSNPFPRCPCPDSPAPLPPSLMPRSLPRLPPLPHLRPSLQPPQAPNPLPPIRFRGGRRGRRGARRLHPRPQHGPREDVPVHHPPPHLPQLPPPKLLPRCCPQECHRQLETGIPPSRSPVPDSSAPVSPRRCPPSPGRCCPPPLSLVLGGWYWMPRTSDKQGRRKGDARHPAARGGIRKADALHLMLFASPQKRTKGLDGPAPDPKHLRDP